MRTFWRSYSARSFLTSRTAPTTIQMILGDVWRDSRQLPHGRFARRAHQPAVVLVPASVKLTAEAMLQVEGVEGGGERTEIRPNHYETRQAEGLEAM